jgi:hypothetical protein
MVELDDVRYLLETLLKLLNLVSTRLSWGKEVWGIVDQTFLKCPLSLITGGMPNIRFSFMTKRPCSKTKRSLFTKSRSEEFLTGRNRERGTSMPWAFLKCFTAEPAAVSILKVFEKRETLEKRSQLPESLIAHRPALSDWK